MLRRIIYFVFGIFNHPVKTHRNDGRVTKYNPYTDKW